jgi:hypothetical protein
MKKLNPLTKQIEKFEILNEKLKYFESEKRELGTETIRIAHGHNHYVLDECKDYRKDITKVTISYIDEQIEKLKKQIAALLISEP